MKILAATKQIKCDECGCKIEENEPHMLIENKRFCCACIDLISEELIETWFSWNRS